MLRYIALATLLATGAASAASYDVSLGGRTVGAIEHVPGRLASVFDNTPLGVGNGRYEGTSTREQSGVRYVGQSDTRRIEFWLENGTAYAIDVTPLSELTPLSDPDAVPNGVVDPVTGFAILEDAVDCPSRFRIYDGRRVVELTLEEHVISDGALTCTMAYRVIAGPGHVSPFRIKSMRLTAFYGLSGGRVTGLAGIDIRAGGFTLTLARR